MTAFGKFLLMFLLALIAGVSTLIVKNFRPQNALPAIETKETATTTVPHTETDSQKKTVSKPKKILEKSPASARTIPLPPPPLVTKMVEPDWNSINEQTRAALVNILCVAKNGDVFQPLSGSGVFIDPRGVILTNAHVAQYVLLSGGDAKSNLLDCTVRVGNPAVNRYRAAVLFISPKWVADNAKNLLEDNPKEDGEHDYALLIVTGTTDPNTILPASLPFIPLREDSLQVDTKDAFLAAGYPAGFLGGIAVQRELYSVSSLATIQSRYTFVENTLDVVGLGGNLLAQKGSSGGAVVDGVGALAGLIVTATVEGATDARDVRALTTDYVARTFAEEAGFPLFALKNADLTSLSQQFNTQIAPILRKKLTDVVYKTNN